MLAVLHGILCKHGARSLSYPQGVSCLFSNVMGLGVLMHIWVALSISKTLCLHGSLSCLHSCDAISSPVPSPRVEFRLDEPLYVTRITETRLCCRKALSYWTRRGGKHHRLLRFARIPLPGLEQGSVGMLRAGPPNTHISHEAITSLASKISTDPEAASHAAVPFDREMWLRVCRGS